jgi:hypothetical protein
LAAVGGGVQGRININTIQDQRVLQGLVNDPAGTTTYADALWGNTTTPSYIIGSRTRNAVLKTQPNGTTQWNVPRPDKTVDDAEPTDPNIATYDRPFKPFGVATFAPLGQTVAAGGSGLQDTLLRLNATTNQPYLAVPGQTDPYLQAEMARKILNNTTTTSNVFGVWITVGYFEVRVDAAGNPLTVDEGGGNLRNLIGKEAHYEVPGDIRQQFFAIIDRTQIGLEPNSVAAGTPTRFTGQPFSTSLEASAPAGATTITVAGVFAAPNGYVYTGDAQNGGVGGAAVNLVGTPVVIGSGATAEVRTIAAVDVAPPAPAAGTVRVVLSAALTNSHGAGVVVSNMVPGNPGPQAGFDRLSNATGSYQYVVPYLTRIR